jgi:hypothetical protein
MILAACLPLAACERGDEPAKTTSAPPGDSVADAPAAAPAPVVLVDTTVPPAVAGVEGWDYHLRASVDLDGDGQTERASLIALVGRGPDPDDGFLWDDGQPWQLYIEEPDGTRTYAYRRFVQLGSVEAHVSTAQSGGGRVLLVVEQLPQAMRIYEVTYAGPGRVTAVERLTRELHPESGFAAEHSMGNP